jgi:hypothetical protein
MSLVFGKLSFAPSKGIVSIMLNEFQESNLDFDFVTVEQFS